MLQMNAHDLNRFLDDAFGASRSYVVDDVNDQRLIARVRADAVTLRPGGTISGPTLMALADGAAYCLILAHIGPVALAVTSSLNISFLRKPERGDVVGEATFLKLGRKLAVVDVRIRSKASVELVAQAVVTYAIPSAR
jgi:uncharacterized protein (TIGR00369 family)